jgi:hypothetical protein
MSVVAIPWSKSRDGYSFFWRMPGNLIPTPNHKYRIIITFTLEAAYGGESFILVWEARTKNPEA